MPYRCRPLFDVRMVNHLVALITAEPVAVLGGVVLVLTAVFSRR
tara:strand:+ start:566 stop:697 length:132 start_codon:yes stop_codon:yes gene_type:complete